MCGIFGSALIDKNSSQVSLMRQLRDAQEALLHRGPDDQGLELFSVDAGRNASGALLALGHTRLSIIDLSPGGHQPMHSGDTRYAIVFNGEIYNYRELRNELKGLGHCFVTDSDTEVLLVAWASWGVKVLRRLVGMFAFAVYDRADESLTLVRDGFGIKPLFYQHDKTGFRFASEISALLCLLDKKPETNLQQAYEYLVFGSYDNSETTFYTGIQHLLPGHVLRIELGSLNVSKAERWWWPSIAERSTLSFQDAAAQLREMFLNNVRLHLRSDVPVGAALSGGIDSSAVVCAMRHLEPDMPIHTFSFVARGSSVDEEKWVDIVNEHVGAIPHKVALQPNELVRDLNDLVLTQGEPFGSTSIYAQYRVFKAARDAGIVVTLDGQGADEMLAGYDGYPGSYVRSLLEKGQYVETLSFILAWSKGPNRTRKQGIRVLGSVLTPQSLETIARRLVGQNAKPRWLKLQNLLDSGVRMGFQKYPSSGKSEVLGRRLSEQLRFSLTGGGLAALLRHGDRNAMRWSIESRVPFLTIDMTEFLLSLPESYLISSKGETKHIFREAMRGLVPDPILDRKDKIGFRAPEEEWLNSHGLEILESISSQKTDASFLNAEICRNHLKKLFDKKSNSNSQAWRLLNYQAWHGQIQKQS
jgi:asparagine synthase (glutamine-hydrolysing)